MKTVNLLPFAAMLLSTGCNRVHVVELGPAPVLATYGENNPMDTFAATIGSTTYTGGYLFLATDEQTMDITIETLDAAGGNVIFSKTIKDVALKRNRQTTLNGPIYSANTQASSFQLNTAWISPATEIPF